MIDVVKNSKIGIFFIFLLFLITESNCISHKSYKLDSSFVVYSPSKSYHINSINNHTIINTKSEYNDKMIGINRLKLSNNINELVSQNVSVNNIIHAYIASKNIKLDSSIKTLILSGVYGLRIFKCMLYLRYILEWLPQVNPYLPPFCILYNSTNNFIAFFQKICPQIMGFDFSGFLVWFFLENMEFLLMHILSNY